MNKLTTFGLFALLTATAACTSTVDDGDASEASVSVSIEGRCGGFLGLTCGEDEFCSYTRKDICGAADALGTCKPRPEACAEIYFPVCGCDGETYSNECFANGAGVSIVSEGACDEPKKPEPRACGGFAGLQCGENEFCNYKLEHICGGADHMGTCDPVPEACIMLHDPVCGCDNQTYSNECFANAAGVAVFKRGACP